MPSSPSDAVAATAPSGEAPALAAASLDIRQRSWLKRLLPQSMFGRSLLLIVMPLVLVQIIATWVFYARHCETVSRRLSADTAGDIGLVIDAMRYTDTAPELARLLENASYLTGIACGVARGAAVASERAAGRGQVEGEGRFAMAGGVG